MNFKNEIVTKLTVMNFLQFFVWGAWLISLGGYMYGTYAAQDGKDIGIAIGRTYGSMGWASLIMPALMGIVADKYLSAQKVLGICHIIAGGIIFFATKAATSTEMYWTIFLTCCFYMPTIALNNSVSYALLEKNNLDIQKSFAPIRVFGTVGFIVAMWATDLFGWKSNTNQFIFAAVAMGITGLYSILLPDCPPKGIQANQTFTQRLGLDAFVLLKNRRMLLFFIFSILLGAALQITNMFGDSFIRSFEKIEAFKDTFAVKHSVLIISLSQISETLFILTIPFFLKRFGIKQVMLFSMVAWVLRFAFFGIGTPEGVGLVCLILSMIVYGMAFDFFNISGSLFVEKETDVKMRSSAQGLFMLATNGLGAIIGGEFAGRVVGYFSTNDNTNWQNAWFTFAGYALIITIVFALVFKYKHNPNETIEVKH